MILFFLMDLIYTGKSLPKDVCLKIIEKFDKIYEKQEIGNTQISNVEYHKKHIIDYLSDDWKSIYNYLYYEINIHAVKYINWLNLQLKDNKYIFFYNSEKFLITNFVITKFEKSTINPNKLNNIIFDSNCESYSIMVFIWILNILH